MGPVSDLLAGSLSYRAKVLEATNEPQLFSAVTYFVIGSRVYLGRPASRSRHVPMTPFGARVPLLTNCRQVRTGPRSCR